MDEEKPPIKLQLSNSFGQHGVRNVEPITLQVSDALREHAPKLIAELEKVATIVPVSILPSHSPARVMSNPLRVTRGHYGDLVAASHLSEDHKEIFDNLTKNGIEFIETPQPGEYCPDYSVCFMYPHKIKPIDFEALKTKTHTLPIHNDSEDDELTQAPDIVPSKLLRGLLSRLK